MPWGVSKFHKVQKIRKRLNHFIDPYMRSEVSLVSKVQGFLLKRLVVHKTDFYLLSLITCWKDPRPLDEKLSKVIRVPDNAPPSRDEEFLSMCAADSFQI